MASNNTGSIQGSISLNRGSSLNLPPIEEEEENQPSLLNYLILLPILVFQFYHLVNLPLKITFDGHGYIFLSQLITQGFSGAADFSNWDFLRTPIYPALISLASFPFGLSAMSLKVASTLSATAGVLVLGIVYGKYLKIRYFAFPLILIILFPQFIAYQHCALSETTTFFFVALIIWAAVNYFYTEEKLPAVILLILTLVLGYYARPTLIYLLIPIIAGILICEEDKARAFIYSGATIFLSLLFVLPWQFKMASSGREASQVSFAIVNQALIEPGAEIFIEPEYTNAVNNSKRNGELTPSGVFDSYIPPISEKLQKKYGDRLRGEFFRLISNSPGRYIQGFGRGLQLLWGFDGLESENAAIKSAIFSDFPTSAEIDGGPLYQESQTRSMVQITPLEKAALAKYLSNLYPYTHILIKSACLISLFIFFRAIFNRNGVVLMITGIPLFFIIFHAGILFSIDRVAVPAWAILISNIFLLSPSSIVFKKKR